MKPYPKRSCEELEDIEENKVVIEAIKKVKDPELGLDLWLLGLIYDIKITDKEVEVVMTLTTPFCPFGPQMVGEVEQEVKKSGFKNVDVKVAFEPAWEPSEELKEMLGI